MNAGKNIKMSQKKTTILPPEITEKLLELTLGKVLLTFLFFCVLFGITGVLLYIGIGFGEKNSIQRYACKNDKCFKDPDGMSINKQDCERSLKYGRCISPPPPPGSGPSGPGTGPGTGPSPTES